ncbi:hypothetical protein EC973_004217 [Apophysomyces ossiformis]|uniref:E3 ubiquitin-protein ligase PEP5 n=1 Tax=Apophysomyces ossiformis TaxID=679940 RepID=A0A8H7BZS8_9FUNG|nr:hypothetical protein EC973_004217 [Apophysomyces ossiformis]
MSLAQWRQFNFFDRQQEIDENNKTKSPEIFQSFLAYDGGRVTHLKQLKQRNILVTVGEEDTLSNVPVVKFWDLDVMGKAKSLDELFAPTCLRTIRIQHGGKPYPVSTFAILENMSQAAIGLANGVVILIRGDLSKDRTTKQKVIYEGGEPITGLGFREQTKSTILFIVTTNSIMSYNTTAKQPAITTLDEQGCGLGCAVMSDAQEMVVGRDEAIYLYDLTGRGPCFAYDTPKSSMMWFKSHYLVIISPPVTTSSHLSSAARASFNFGPNRNGATNELTKLTIFDTANKFVAYSGTFIGGIRGVFCEWNSIWVVGMDGKVYHLDEKDTPTKLEILFKLNLYVLAINLAHMQKYDDASIAEIFKKYGDHLYSKGDYDGAMEQYIRTIGQLEPSYIIRKFLDAQRIYNLTNYLQELHSKGLANADHTTLLLNCYTKLKDVSRLDHFIKTDSDLNFDLETAISVCRQAGYYEHAVYLAEKFEEHDLYLDIVIEDMRNYEIAINYIRKLGPREADSNLRKYSKTLLSQLPEQTTQLLIELCTGMLTTAQPVGGRAVSPTPSDRNTAALANLPFADDSPAQSESGVQRSKPTQNGTNGKHARTKSGMTYVPPSPRIFMPAFVDRPDCLVTFLEKVFEKRWGLNTKSLDRTTNDAASTRSYGTREENGNGNQTNGTPGWSSQEQEERKAIWNTLLELYLMDEQPNPSTSTSPTSSPRRQDAISNREHQKRIKEFKTKALALLKDDSVHYDTNQALVLCQLKQFDEGTVYLYEKTGMYTDILRFWMEKEETDRVIEGVRKYGPKDPSLYPMVLTYFSSTPETLSKSTSELLSVLNHIDSKDLLPPIQVVQALSRSDVATIGLLKNYIGKHIEQERRELQQNEELIDSYREETERRRKEIEELQTRCLGENDRECPHCAIQHHMISEMRRTQEANADRHDLFFEQLDSEEDGFSVIADYFSKNTMAFAKLID